MNIVTCAKVGSNPQMLPDVRCQAEEEQQRRA